MIPIDQYRRDQRIVRGIQRGAYAFSISAAMAAIDLTNRVVSLLQSTAQFAHDVVTPPVPGGNTRIVIYNSQPRDFREGVIVGYAQLKEGVTVSLQEVANAGIMADNVGTRLGKVVCKLPSAIVLPFFHLTQATSSVLLGARNQMKPEARKDDHEKWKNANER